MSNIMKKIVSVVTVLTISALLVGPGVAQAVTAAELQAQIDALLAQIATLQSQLTALGGAPAAACTFTRALYPGVTGNDVKCLQQYLNGAGFPVAASGAGSPGNETTFYGSRSQAAVGAWQDGNGVAYGAYRGYFGPVSQAKYTALGGGPGPSPSPSPSPSPTACTGTEGSYTVVLSASPVSRTVNAGDGIEAYGVDITAVNSDITVGRIDLQAAVVNAVTAVGENPGNFIKAIRVYSGSVSDANLKATFTSPVFTQDTAGLWYTSLTALNIKVAKGATGKVLIVIDTGTTIDQNRTVTLNIYGNNGIRASDCLGINTYAALATTRVLTIQQPGTAVVTVTQAADNPNSNNIKADATNGVQTKETIFSLNAKATGGSAALLRLQVTYASAASLSMLPSILYLYDGDTLVASVTPPVSGVAVFENFVLPLTQDVTKNLKIKASWAAAAGFESGGAAFTLTGAIPVGTAATLLTGVYQRANGQQLGIVNGTIVPSNTFWISESGLKLTFVSGTATYTQQGQTAGVGTATGTIVFKVQPFGGILVEPAYASGATSAAIAVVTSGMLARMEATTAGSANQELYASGTQIQVTRALQSSPTTQNIVEDAEATITLTMTVGTTGTPEGFGLFAGNFRFKVEDICSNVGGTLICQGSGAGIGGAATGNLTDSWITNVVNVIP